MSTITTGGSPVKARSLPSEPLRAPMPWFGGKRRIASLVWERFGDVPNYCEAFAGSLAVLLARPHQPKVETVNDADAYLSNFWRAVQADPEAVAQWADWPVSEPDLHARHRWLVSTGRDRVERLMTDPDYYDVQVAGWWVWGICQWIGSGWCTAAGATWAARPHLAGTGTGGNGVHRKLPAVGDAGRGGHRAPDVHEKRPHLMTSGKGINRQLPHVGNPGRGVHRPGPSRQLPHLYHGGRGVSQAPGSGAAAEQRTAWLIGYMRALSDRLRHVRVCCGDWTRVMGPSVTVHNGLTGVLLDPPYSHDEREPDIYAVETNVAADVRAWALANGDNPNLRIALCGYASEHDMPDTWEAVPWKANGGYGSQGEGRGRDNASREVVWFSPHCLKSNRARQLALIEEAL